MLYGLSVMRLVLRLSGVAHAVVELLLVGSVTLRTLVFVGVGAAL
jgi:hypothetical protein